MSILFPRCTGEIFKPPYDSNIAEPLAGKTNRLWDKLEDHSENFKTVEHR